MSERNDLNLLIQINDTDNEDDIIKEFKDINKSCPVPMLYVEEFNDFYTSPELKLFSGKILYIDQRVPVTRADTQLEDVRLVFGF